MNGIPPNRYLFFGGKGGVGKTTAAAATALLLLKEARSGERILLFSTDPAHSLADSLETPIGPQIREVASYAQARLDAWEMDAGAALREFKERHSGVLKTIADRGTLLDEADINNLLELSLPGLDEVMALFELSEFDREQIYCRIVVDTAPSGHTTRLLQLPHVFERWIGALDRMSEKHRYMAARLASRRAPRVPDAADVFLRDLSERVRRVREILGSPETSSFVMVTIPEAMAVEETIRYVRSARAEGAPITDLIVNRVEAVHGSCPYCRARHASQRPHLARLKTEFRDLHQHRVPLLHHEVRGMDGLREFGRMLWLASNPDHPASLRSHPSSRGVEEATMRDGLGLSHPQFLIIGGKGGVGKTTTAAALALRFAEEHPTKRCLIFSTDPAHSLSDSFGESIGPFKTGLAGLPNLDGIEIDAVDAFENLKTRYRDWIEEIFISLTGSSNWRVEFDREAMQELIALAPPGIDEIAALSAISDFLERGTYTSIVLDTAPTGHLLRFLELPQLVLDWVRTLMRLLLKYREVITPSSVAEELLALSKRIKRIMTAFKDAKLCDFMAVAIPERMSLAETQDLVAGVKGLGISANHILINNVVPVEAAADCNFCAERRSGQLQTIERFQTDFSGQIVLSMGEQLPGEVSGPDPLRHYLSRWLSMDQRQVRGGGGA